MRADDDRVGVLVVDDDLGTRETFGATLRLRGCRVELAETAAEALAFIHDARIDLALVDLRLVEANGLELLGWIRGTRPSTRCVLMTGFGSSDIALEAGRLGAVAYLEKPIDENQLARVLHDYAPSPGPSTTAPRHGWYTIRARALIEEHYRHSSFGPGDAARILNVSVEHLSRETKRDTGFTVGDLLRERRLREARRLLDETTCRIKEIAERSGFGNPSRMDHAFHDAYCLTPNTTLSGSLGVIHRVR